MLKKDEGRRTRDERRTTNSVRIAALQMNCLLGDRVANLAQAESLLAGVAGQADVACLPELFTTGYNLDALGSALFDLAEVVPAAPEGAAGPTVTRLCELAGELGLAICFEAAFPPIFSTRALQGAQIVFNPFCVASGPSSINFSIVRGKRES